MTVPKIISLYTGAGGLDFEFEAAEGSSHGDPEASPTRDATARYALGMAKRHERRHFPDELMNVPVVDLSPGQWKALDDKVDSMLRSDGIVSRYDTRTGKGTLTDQAGRTFEFTSKRKYLRRGVGVSFIAGRTRAYHIRRERMVVVDGAR